MVCLLAASATWAGLGEWTEPTAPAKPAGGSAVGPRHVRALTRAYQRWESAYEAAGGDRARTLRLQWSHALTGGPTEAWGQVRLDLVEGRVDAAVARAPGESFDLWLVDNRPGPKRSVKPEAGDEMVLVGTLRPDGALARLAGAPLPASEGFEIDLAAVTRAGERPDEATPVLVGYRNLFHRLRDARRGGDARFAGVGLRDLSLLPRPAWADHHLPELDLLVEAGEELFEEAEFDGNGRTCESCHAETNNFTIDAPFVATLDPSDPLFAAETQPALAAHFELPEAMRTLGLVLENQDGTDELATRFNLRGVPHILGMTQSLDVFFFDPEEAASGEVVEAIGWAGDGSPCTNAGGIAPCDGALRDFALGAIAQHFTRTLGRTACDEPGEDADDGDCDFDLPTDEELDALEAYQLAQGRQEELDLDRLEFVDPFVAEGAEVFEGPGRCDECHRNGGANDEDEHRFGGRFAFGNLNFNTGVEDAPVPARDELVALAVADGGFGTEPCEDLPGDLDTGLETAPDTGQANRTPPVSCVDFAPSFGDGTFNVTSVIEAADTAPFFHNNVSATLLEAVEFYSSDAFNQSPAAAEQGEIHLDAEQNANLVAFLSVLNALDNVDLVERAATDALGLDASSAAPHLSAALLEVEDARAVLLTADVHADARVFLDMAESFLRTAKATDDGVERDATVQLAVHALNAARDAMVRVDEDDEHEETTEVEP
ncbi:MAG: hypothetical protein ACOZNI_18615 [Myxococcota bacterium]